MISGKGLLTIGPDYRYPNGGIAKLINTYSNFFDKFHFVATMRAPEHGKESQVKTLIRMILGIIQMIYLILFKRIRIVHIHTASGISFIRESIFLYIASFLGAKTVFHMHSGSLVEFYNKYPKLVGRSLKKADVIITIAKVWENFLKGRGHNNVVTIGNPITKPNITLNRSLDERVNILFLGLICDNKGIWDILDVIKDNKDYFEGKAMLKIGGNGDVSRLKDYISGNCLEKIVEYIGWIEGEKKAEILFNSDIYIQPSYREALGIAILEAMSYKLPIIASNTGGIPEIVVNNHNGILIEPGDKRALFNALKILIESSEKRKEYGSNGLKIAESYFPEVIMGELTNLYNTLR